jgi:hypothetical protein
MCRRVGLWLVPLFVTWTTAARAADALDPQPTQRHGIAIRLPADWKLQPRDAAHMLLAAEAPAPDSDTTGDYAPRLTITSAPGSAIDGPGQQSHLAQEIPNYQPTERPTDTTINGIKGVTFGGTFTAGALKLRSRQYLLIHADHLYTLTILSLASTWEQHVAAADASIQTFTFTKK